MKHVRKSVLLWYSPSEMYALVTDVESYPAFLPWCQSAQVLKHHADGVTARLGMSYMGVKQSFTTRNHQTEPATVRLQLIDGPFSELEGLWLFKALGAAGTGPAACKVEFDLRYAFASPALEAVVSPVFDKVADTLVESFVQRAQAVYGER